RCKLKRRKDECHYREWRCAMSSLRRSAIILLASTLALHAEANSRDFYEAVRSNDLARLKSMLAQGHQADLRDSRGTTPLMHGLYALGHGASRAPKLQPYFQSGFPHDHDQWISASATAWAAAALAEAGEPERRSASLR